MTRSCIVCGSDADYGSIGAIRQFDCTRCGCFEISGSAVGVLTGRINCPPGNTDPLVVAKVGHYIRTHTTRDDWLRIDTNLIDDMVAQVLPAPARQLENLIRWMAGKVSDDHFRALEFAGIDVCAVMGAASPDAADDAIDDAIERGLIEFVPDDAYRLTSVAWDRLEVDDTPAPGQRQGQDFIDARRIAELRAIRSDRFDLSRLVRMCEEINSAWRFGNMISVAMLARAIADHIPPIFGRENFAQVSSNASRSARGILSHIEGSLRHIADGALHTHIRRREVLPTPTQVDFRPSFDFLLGEVVRHLG